VLAGDVMTPDPETVTPEATISEAWELMRERNIRHVPVIKDGALVGMLSDRDLLFAEAEDRTERGRSTLAGAVVAAMTSDVLSVEPDTDLSEVISIMLEARVGAVPVVRAGTRELVGIVSYVDVLRAAQDLFEEE
jgi:CBS domain-containing protein